MQSRPCDTGFTHIAFDVDDIDAAIGACASHGILPIGDPVPTDNGPNKGGCVVYTRDPDDVTIVFIEKPGGYRIHRKTWRLMSREPDFCFA